MPPASPAEVHVIMQKKRMAKDPTVPPCFPLARARSGGPLREAPLAFRLVKLVPLLERVRPTMADPARDSAAKNCLAVLYKTVRARRLA